LALGSCNAGECSYDEAPSGVACDDGLDCTSNDACDGQGECVGAEDAACQPTEGGAPAIGGANDGGTLAENGGAADLPSGGVSSGAGGHSGGKGLATPSNAGESSAETEPVANDPGCGCKLGPATPQRPHSSISALALLLGLAWRRRRRQKTRM
jgi:MYXO-CTERM domain-containing protein